MRYICPTLNPRTTNPGYLSQESSGRNSPLRTGISSLSTTRRFLPTLGHHLQVIPEPYQMLLGFQMVENQEHLLPPRTRRRSPSSDIDQVLSVNRANTRTLKTSYIFTKAKTNVSLHQLIDRGANGGLEGSYMRILHRTGCKINIVGIDNHEVTGLDVVTGASLIDTNQGKSLAYSMNMLSLVKETPSFHLAKWNISRPGWMTNPSKLEASKCWRHWKDMPCPSSSRMAWHTCKTLGRPNDQELETYPHVIFTSPDTWEPSLLDHEFSQEDELSWSQLQDTRSFYDPLFDAQGDLNQRIIAP